MLDFTIHADQNGFKYINIIFEECTMAINYVEETIYSTSLVNADGIIAQKLFCHLIK